MKRLRLLVEHGTVRAVSHGVEENEELDRPVRCAVLRDGRNRLECSVVRDRVCVDVAWRVKRV